MALDTYLEFSSALVQAIVIGLLIYRRVYRSLPLFSSYLAWVLIVQGASVLMARVDPVRYSRIFLFLSIVDSLFMVCVLVELTMSVLMPIRSSLPRWSYLVVGFFMLVVFAIIWPFAKPPGLNVLQPISQWILHLDVTTSVLRIVFFLALAGLSQFLSIGWRDRELQISTGLGFYSLVSLSAMLMHMNQGTSTQDAIRIYHLLDDVVSGSYIVSMVYWVVSFAQKVPERREFTPQMQSFLLALAGNARTTRLAMTSSAEFKKGKNPE